MSPREVPLGKAPLRETLLREVNEWPRELVARFEAAWIDTVQRIVAISATEGGLCSLAQQAGVSLDEMRDLVAIARSYLAPEQLEELETPVDTRDFSLGALEPPPPEGRGVDFAAGVRLKWPLDLGIRLAALISWRSGCIARRHVLSRLPPACAVPRPGVGEASTDRR